MATALLIGSLILALTSPGSPPQPPAQSRACSLLTSSDIEAATGSKPDATPLPGQVPVPGTNDTMNMCTWVVRPLEGQVVVSTARLPPGASSTSYAKNNAGMDALRAQHWKEESKDFGNAYCSIMTPPAGTKDSVMMSSCAAGPKGTLLSVVFMSPSRKLSLVQAKGLLDKAAARVP